MPGTPSPLSAAAPTVVVGATGKTGRRVAAELERRGVAVRAAARPTFDWEDRATWAPVLRGARAAYVAFVPDLAMPGADEALGAFAALAADAGLERLVLLSGRGEPDAQAAEDAVRAAGVPTTVVRSSWFMQNFSESFLLDAVRDGAIALPVDPAVPEPFVDAGDVAAVAVAALTANGDAAALYEVTGPRALTFAEAAAAIGAAAGRELPFVPVPLADYAEAATAQGVPGDVVELLSYLFTEVLDGRNAEPADGVPRALGRPARDFAQYVTETAATGVWHV